MRAYPKEILNKIKKSRRQKKMSLTADILQHDVASIVANNVIDYSIQTKNCHISLTLKNHEYEYDKSFVVTYYLEREQLVVNEFDCNEHSLGDEYVKVPEETNDFDEEFIIVKPTRNTPPMVFVFNKKTYQLKLAFGDYGFKEETSENAGHVGKNGEFIVDWGIFQN
jgi:hypothetical protein